MYTVNAVLWWVRMLGILSVHNRLGPYIMMVGKMVRLRYRFAKYAHLPCAGNQYDLHHHYTVGGAHRLRSRAPEYHLSERAVVVDARA